MKNVLMAAVLVGLVGVVNADEVTDYVNANMLWGDNQEFQEVNCVEDREVEVVDFSAYEHEADVYVEGIDD